MLFFQVVLFAGYCYAHLLQRWLAPRRQAIVHLAVVAAGLALLPILPGPYWKPHDSSNPTWQILLLLTGTVGLPYFALSATSPLVQSWFSGVWPHRSPYRLYALSNAGSLVALLSYPFLFEPAFDLRLQSLLWSGAFLLYAALSAVTLASVWRLGHLPQDDPQPENSPPSNAAALSGKKYPPKENVTASEPRSSIWLDRLRWLALPACASLMLLAVTNHLCQDVAVVPFLWVVPLALYLLSFIITFDHSRWYVRWLWAAAAVVALVGSVANDLTQSFNTLSLQEELALYLGAMFSVCMVCHGELARLKPSPRHLTAFYLLISAGGALGGLFVGAVAPLIFSSFLEWQIGITISLTLCLGLLLLPRRKKNDEKEPTKPTVAQARSIREKSRAKTPAPSAPPREQKRSPRIVTLRRTPSVPPREHKRSSGFLILRRTLFVCAMIVVLLYLAFWTLFVPQTAVDRARNFFGVLMVYREEDPRGPSYWLLNGPIRHGAQSADPAKRRWPITYFSESSGMGKALCYLQKSGPVRVGVIGLGVGTIAAYARPGDDFRFYEINPEVVRMAKQHFTYLADCRGKCDVVLGDARLSLESEPPQNFDFFVLDAFTGDAIPTHLLTREAFAIYQQHLAPGGVMAFHISNKYLRLAPVVRRLAEDCGMQTSRIMDVGDWRRFAEPSCWILATRNSAFLKANPSRPLNWGEDGGPAPLWTDRYSNLFQILKSP